MIDYDLNKIYQWPIGLRIVVTAIICVIILYLGYFFDLSGMQKQLLISQKKEEQLIQSYRAVITQQVSLSREVTVLPQLKKMYQELHKKLINPSDLNAALNDLIKTNNFSLELKFLKEESSQKIGLWTKTLFDMTVVGDYEATGHFLSKIANMPMLVKMGKFTMTSQVRAEKNDNTNSKKEKSLPTLLSHDNILETHLMLEVYED